VSVVELLSGGHHYDDVDGSGSQQGSSDAQQLQNLSVEDRRRDSGITLSYSEGIIAFHGMSYAMRRTICFLTALLFLGAYTLAWGQDQTPQPPKPLPNGVYAVLRDSLKEKDVLPLKDGEALLVNRHRYLKKEDQESPRFLVVRAAPDVNLDLTGEPKAIKEGEEVVGLLLKLQPKAATALERLTTDQRDKAIAIVVSGEVVTTHKVREVIKSGEVQITSCAPGAAKYLLEQLQQARHKNK
jgi:hypothetical protein